VLAGHGLEVLSAYIGLPLFLGLWLVHRMVTKSKLVKLTEMDLNAPEDIEESAAVRSARTGMKN